MQSGVSGYASSSMLLEFYGLIISLNKKGMCLLSMGLRCDNYNQGEYVSKISLSSHKLRNLGK